MARYRILDEPRPGALSKAAVRPFWPLLACMVGGPWIGWPWFVVNSLAVGGVKRVPTIVTAIVGMLGAAGIVVAFATALQGGLGRMAQNFWLLGLVVWKLGIAYVLYLLQHRDVELFEYYRGTVRNGLFVVIAAYFLEPKLMGVLSTFLRLMLR